MDKLGQMTKHKLLLLAVACTWSIGAAAQWQWIDKNGQKVFSDRPPPQDIPEPSILKQPGGTRPTRTAPVAATTGGTPGAGTAAEAAKRPASSAVGNTKDKALEEKLAQAEAEQAAQKKAQEEKIAKAKADNCTRARQAKATFDSGRPVTQSNAQGERIFLDEAGRAAEIKRVDGVIAADCVR